MINQIRAFEKTVELAIERNLPHAPDSVFGLTHIGSMLRQARLFADDEAKVGRWLGWAQCAVVLQGYATLEEMKVINVSSKYE